MTIEWVVVVVVVVVGSSSVSTRFENMFMELASLRMDSNFHHLASSVLGQIAAVSTNFL